MCANKCLPINCICRKRKGFSLKLLKSDKQFQQSFSELGRNWELSNELFEQMEKFTCRMYAPKQQSVSVNKIRYQLFCAKSGDIESHQLPPCHDCLRKHTQWANYQPGLWRRSLSNNAQALNPTGNGWTLETVDSNDILAIDWMHVQLAPDAVLELLACSCPKECIIESCACLINNLKCTDMCKLKTFANQLLSDDPAEANTTDQEHQDIWILRNLT